MAWTAPRTWVASELVTASLMNTHVRDNLLALQGGSIGLTQLQLAGGASDPAVSAAGAAIVFYNSSSNQIRASSNAGAFAPIGGGPTADIQDWIVMANALGGDS